MATARAPQSASSTPNASRARRTAVRSARKSTPARAYLRCSAPAIAPKCEKADAISRAGLLARDATQSVSEIAHLLADLPERLLLQLTDALARQVVLVADLLQRELVLVVEAEAPA